MGLATAYGIVTETDGAIDVESTVGSGTTFRVLLPRSTEPADIEIVKVEQPVASGSGTVLLVEDENGVRRFVQSALERNGFNVLSAAYATDALRLAEGHQGFFDAVVTSVDMPDMNGNELARALIQSAPNAPVLFLSGSSRQHVETPGVQTVLKNFLQKPFGEDELVEAVRRTISRARNE